MAHVPRKGTCGVEQLTVPATLQGLESNLTGAATSGGFSLHAGFDIAPGQRAKLE